MRILITGAGGLIGTALQRSFEERGYEVLLASRREAEDEQHIQWNSATGFADEDLSRIEGLDAVIHLAGEAIAGLRWTDEKKKAIRDSRVHGTRTMIEAFSKIKEKPRTFIAASAIGFYGDRADEELTETSAVGDTFLAETCREWEAESRRAEDLGIRTVILRTGIVLSKHGGALATMMTPFKFGVGGVIGGGKQWMSWISLEDVVSIVNFALENANLRGAVNVTAPKPVTNEEFTKAMGEVLYRPTIIPLPEFAVHMLMGEMGDALLLDSTRVIPQRLIDAGFEFSYPDLHSALKRALE